MATQIGGHFESMDWIHCNVCFSQPAASGDGGPLYLTSCGHIFCHDCRREGFKNGSCKICDRKCSCVQLVQDMKPEVQEFFTEPDEILTKLINIIQFQKQHRVKLTAYRVSLENKYKESKTQLKKMTQVAQKMYNDLLKLQKENKELKAALIPQSHSRNPPIAAHSTPVPVFLSPNNSVMPNQHPKNQIFQSKLVTPHRVIRSQHLRRHDSKEYYNRTNCKMPTSWLTPSSTASSNNSCN